MRVSKRTATAGLHQCSSPQLGEAQFPGVLIHGRSRLSAAVAFRVVETKWGNGMFASAFEGGAAAHRPDGVISHNLIVVLLPGTTSGQEVLTLRSCEADRGAQSATRH